MSKQRLNKHLRDVRRYAAQLGVQDVWIENRGSTHKMLHGTVQGKPIRVTLSSTIGGGRGVLNEWKCLERTVKGAANPLT